MKILQLLALPLCFFLSNCVGPSYKIPAGYTGPMATLKNSGSAVSAVRAEIFNVYKIDGLHSNAKSPMATPYGGGPFVTLRESYTEIPAKKVIVNIVGHDLYAADGMALLGKLSGAERKPVSGDVELNPKPNGVYVVRGLLGKQSSSVWIEDAATGKPVTRKVVSGE